jgi:hypothetical protein
MKRKTILTIVSLALILIFIAACDDSNGGGTSARAVPNTERIQSDIATNAISPIPSNRTVDSIEIINEETDTDTGQHSATVRVFSNDSEVAYTENMRVVYIRNEDREWVLSAITSDSSAPVLMSPLVGANVSLVREAILGANLIIDGENWVVDDSNLESVTIASQETNLEQNRDTMTVNVELKDVVLSADGQMLVEFRFNNGIWELSEYRVGTMFETSMLPNAALNVTDDDLMAIIVRHEVSYDPTTAIRAQEIMIEQATLDLVGAMTGMPFLSALLGGGSSEQVMSVSSDEISDFIFVDSVAREKGTEISFFSSFTLKKELVDFNVFSQVIYYFDPVNGWGLQDVGFTSVISAIHLENTMWVSRTGERFTMIITEITPLTDIDVAVDVVVNLTFLQGFDQIPPGDWRYSARGFLNLSELIIGVNFVEWIGQVPMRTSRNEHPGLDLLSGRINVQDSSISGNVRRHGSSIGAGNFNLYLTEFVEVSVDLDVSDEVDENGDD